MVRPMNNATYVRALFRTQKKTMAAPEVSDSDCVSLVGARKWTK